MVGLLKNFQPIAKLISYAQRKRQQLTDMALSCLQHQEEAVFPLRTGQRAADKLALERKVVSLPINMKY